jgi:RIP metalloprotease RseP
VDFVSKKQKFPAFYFVSYNEYFEGKIFLKNGNDYEPLPIETFIQKINSKPTDVETTENAGKGEALKSYLSTVYFKDGENYYTLDTQIETLLKGDADKGIYASITYSKSSTSIGIIQQYVARDYSFFGAIVRAFPYAFYLCGMIISSLLGLFTGAISVSEAGGTITAVSQIAQISEMGIEYFLLLLPLLSANLAVFNVLPIPSLDGARSVFVLIEIIFRKPVPRHIEGWIHTIGLFALLALVVFLDINHFATASYILQL